MEQIVEFSKSRKQWKSHDNSFTKFNVGKLEAIMKGVEDYPAIIVSITGDYRSGKSFLMNLMVTYLQYLTDNVSTIQLIVVYKDSFLSVNNL